jgi:hypothetical protein
MGSPDLTPYIDLRFFDKDPQDIFDTAITELQSRLPDWSPREGNVEVLLAEAFALQIAEAIFAINRLPGAIVMALLRMYGVEPDAGAQPTVNLTFTISDNLGHDIPAGTAARMDLEGGFEPIVFTTVEALAVPPGSNTGTVLALGDRYTAEGNGVIAGTRLELIDSIAYVDVVESADLVVGGLDPETDDEWIERGVQRFARLSETLVLPRHFEAAALEDPAVLRAKALDNFAPGVLATPTGVTATPAATGGTLAAGAKSYRVSAINAFGQTLASAAATCTTTGSTSKVTVAWSAVVPADGASPVTGYKIYGRTSGSELLMATVGAGVLTWDDTGSVTPAGALPSSNTTGSTPGNYAGHVTVAVYGDGAVVPTPDKTALEADLEASAAANLDVHIMDPTVQAIDVTVEVRRETGFDNATVIASVTAALQAFLSTAAWDWGSTVYRNELISVISNADGVDFVTTLTSPATDVALSGYATLVTAGTLTVTTVA